MNEEDKKEPVECSMCGFLAETEEEESLVAKGILGNVCIHCLQAAMKVIYGESAEITGKESIDSAHIDALNEEISSIITPKEMFGRASQYVIGQDEAIKKVCNSVYYHLKRFQLNKDKSYLDDGYIKKKNILLVGPSGVGKTEVVTRVGDVASVEVCDFDASPLTEKGYEGPSIDDIFVKLYYQCEGDVARMERSIVFLDEIDKLGHKRDGNIGGAGVQHQLLKIIEGTDYIFRVGDKGLSPKDVEVDTRNILFVMAGAFSGVDKFMSSKQIGFNAVNTSSINEVNVEILTKYGMSPEFINRIGAIINLNKLDKETISKIIRNPKGSVITEYQTLLENEGITLKPISDEVCDIVSDMVISNGTNARGVRNVFDNAFEKVLYEAPDMSENSVVELVISGTDKKTVTASFIEKHS